MSNEIEADEVGQKEFLVALRGYDREQVDAYLREIAEELRRLRSASESAVAPAPSSAAEVYKGIGEKTSQILVAAEEAGEEIKTTARDEAARILTDTRMEATSLARTSQNERRQAEQEIRKLRDARNLLKTQLEDVGRRLEEMISRLDSPMDIPDTDVGPEPPPAPVAAPPRAEPPAAPMRRPEPEPAAPPARPEPAPPPPAAPSRPEKAQPAAAQAPTAQPTKVAPAGTAPTADTGMLTELKDLLEEVRREREAARHEVEAVMSEVAAEPAEQPIAIEVPPEVARRSALLGDLAVSTSSKLKRALQEDQNVLLDRLRTNKKGSFEDTFAPMEEQRQRFVEFVREPLESSYRAGLGAGGASGGEAGAAVEDLISKQLVAPLRKEVSRIIDSGIEAQDTSSSISDRSGDVYRVWKGVRTELLGEGMSYAAFHQGLTEAWRKAGKSQMVWILSGDEIDCPRNVCETNASSGPVEIGSTFPSGHLVPPAHGGCSCTLGEASP